MKPIAFLTLLVIALLLNGCVNLKPKPDKTSLYTLGLNTSSDQTVDTSLVTYYVARPELPGYLHGTKMFVCTESGEIGSLSGARWGEDLGEGIARALGEYIQASGKAFVRSQYPWPKLSNDTEDVRVLFERFGATDDGHVEVVGTWQVRKNRKTVRESRFQFVDLAWDANAPDAYVAQLNKALELLAQDIVDSI
ncbi:PqiC family protein [bacterium]|nr:PqiC family protein [bacterium]